MVPLHDHHVGTGRVAARRRAAHFSAATGNGSHTRGIRLKPETQIIARPGAERALEAWVGEHGTLAEAAAAHDAAGTLAGRGRVYVLPAPVGEGRWVVRHYHRGGAVASRLGDRYLRLGTPRPVREFGLGRSLAALGVPTPPHVGGAVYRGGIWYRGDLVTEHVPRSRDLAAVLFDRTSAGESFDTEAAMRAAGSLVRLLHDRGVTHRDLNLKNILIAAESGPDRLRALVLDLDRASLGARVSERGRHRMLDRFWRSARKWEGRVGRKLDPGLRSAFESGYAGA